ncbi:hypothetical protein AB0C69_01115 [Actinomadura sp. NPDC048032]|uniref:hypothetical protein n=1 Tax=Actinomadura sp. NPDC048032 TaxID=3155747 RepID=UPI0033D77851
MKGLTNLLTILVAALLGGSVGSVVFVVSMGDVISGEDVVGAVMLGGAVGTMFAIIASAGIVLLGKVASHTLLGSGLATLGLIVFGAKAPLLCVIGLGLLAGVLANYIAGRAGTVSAAGTVAPQGQHPESSGDASRK